MLVKRVITGVNGSWRRLLSSNVPPSHFSDPNFIPQVYNHDSKYGSTGENTTTTHTNTYNKQTEVETLDRHNAQSKDNNDRSTKEITTLLVMGVLAYFAVDNYVNRIKLEKLNNETTAINFKTLQIQQANFVKAQKTRDLRVLEERKANARRTFKMALHVAHLRKQLTDLGVQPVNIDQVIRDFEKSVKAENSFQNVSGQVLWIDDDSPLKAYFPDCHEYDKKRRDNDDAL